MLLSSPIVLRGEALMAWRSMSRHDFQDAEEPRFTAQSPKPSVFGRPLDVIDDQEFDGSSGRRQFQSELLLHRSEDRRLG
jgi:hypothetical protein